MNGEIRTGDRYFQGTASYSSQAIQSKLFQSPVKRNVPFLSAMPDTQIEENPASSERRKITTAEWENLGKVGIILYLVTLLALSVSMPVAYFISRDTVDADDETWGWFSPPSFLWVFNIFMYAVALLFLLILHLYIKFERRRAKKFDFDPSPENNNGAEPNGTQPSTDLHREEASNVSRTGDQNIWRRTFNTNVSASTFRHPVNRRGEYMYAYGAPGVNFFLRAGAIGFAFGSMMLDGFRIARFVEDDTALDCFGPLYIAQLGLRMILIFAETLFMTKNHRIVLNFRRAWLNLGFGHLILTNLSMWIMTIIIEAYEGFHASRPEFHEIEEHHSNDSEHRDGSEEERTTTEAPEHHRWSGVEVPEKCSTSSEVLADVMAPYLYPLVIEFALIAAAILYKIFSNIGKLRRVDEGLRQDQELSGAPEANDFSILSHAECHKANSGVFLGLLCLVLNIMITVWYLWTKDESMKEWIYMTGDICMQLLSTLAIALAFYQITKLDFKGLGHAANKIDLVLLLVTLFGLYLLVFCSIIPFIFDDQKREWLWVWILNSVSNFVQATLQMAFIFDGSQREAGTHAQWHHKPGRSFVTFLLFSNLSMWLINSFEMKEALVMEPMIKFYGSVAWTIILFLTLPLAVFFRFHSVVCLSDIWVEVYPKNFKPPREQSFRLSRAESSMYHNAQLQDMHNRLKAVETTFQQHVARISNTHGDNTI